MLQTQPGCSPEETLEVIEYNYFFYPVSQEKINFDIFSSSYK